MPEGSEEGSSALGRWSNPSLLIKHPIYFQIVMDDIIIRKSISKKEEEIESSGHFR